MLPAHVLGRPMRVFKSLSFLLVCFCHSPSIGYCQSTPESRKVVTVPDVIGMVRAADVLHSRPVAHFSPDRTKLAVILRKGDIERNVNEFSIVLWRTAELFGSPRPEHLLTMYSSSNEDAVEDVSWLQDSETIAFLGSESADKRQVFTINVRTHVLKQITHHPGSVYSYSVTPAGDKFAYIAEESPKSLFDNESNQHGLVVSSEPLYSLVVQKANPSYQLFTQHEGGVAKRVKTSHVIAGFPKPFLSPDGSQVLLRVYANRIPERWKDYQDPFVKAQSQEEIAPGQYSFLMQYVLVELSGGQETIVVDAPCTSYASTVAWASDSSSLILGPTYLPIGLDRRPDEQNRKKSQFTVEIRLPSFEVSTIAPTTLHFLEWETGTLQAIFEATSENWSIGNGAQRIYFAKLEGQWRQVTPPAHENPRIQLEEGMNTPPRIVAIDPSGTRRALLLDLNPQLSQLRFGKVEELSLKTSLGGLSKAGLYYPVDYVPGNRYPLVIQTHDWRRDKFFPDGPFTTAFAAQPLAGKNIMVVQLNELASSGSPKEVDANVKLFEDAVAFLDRKGLVDRSRVGIIAFSYTCSHVEYALTHSNLQFAAVSITDGFDAGYLQYLEVSTASPGYAREYEVANGGMPFGKGLKAWLARSPSFRLDKVNAPVRITALNGGSLLAEWEWFAALRRFHKPVELVYLQDGDHVLEKPAERMVSQDGNVDWFTFWLKDEKDQDPAKRSQYIRWTAMRTQH